MANLDRDVIQLVADFTGTNPDEIRRETTLFGDLSVDGVDGEELIEEFGKRFEVDLTGFEPDRHFGSEGVSILAPFILVWWFLRWLFCKPARKSPEENSSLAPIRVSDLILMANEKRWIL